MLDATTVRYTDRLVASHTKSWIIDDTGRRQRLWLEATSSKTLFWGVKPVIKYRGFDWHGVANNVLADDTTCHQRSNIEAAFFALWRKYGEIVRARTWFGQFRELVLKCAVRNVELALDGSNGGIKASKLGQILQLAKRSNQVLFVLPILTHSLVTERQIIEAKLLLVS